MCGAADAAHLLGAVADLAADDVVHRVLGYDWLAVRYADLGNHDAAFEHAELAVAAAVDAGSVALERLARSAAAWVATRRNDGEAAFEHSTRQVELASGDVEVALGLTDLSAAQLLRGRLEEAEMLGREAVTAARRLGPSWTLSEAQRALAFAQLRRGDAAGALTLISSSLRMVAGASDETGLLELVAAIGIATAALGRTSEGRLIVTRAKALATIIPGAEAAIPRELAGLAAELLLREVDLPDLPPVGTLAELIDLATAESDLKRS
jgi:tetratricopeptide (TPR) repeat protein